MPTTSRAPARTWDIWVRFTHWTIAGIVAWNLFGPTDEMHRLVGYGAAMLVFLRIVWGFVGSQPARFATWWPARRHLAEYMRSLIAGKPIDHVSHNPLGALMALTLWLLIVALAFSGWLMRLDAFWGEDWPHDIHTFLSIALEACVCVHIIAAVVMSCWTGINLIGAMVTGRKRTKE